LQPAISTTPATTETPPVLEITGRERASDSLWRSIVRYRWVIIALVSRDLKMRYRGSVLGFLWTFLNPLLFMSVYTLVFSIYFLVGAKGYPVFLLSGLLAWLWFGQSIQLGTVSILEGSMYVGRTIFPTQILPFVPVVSSMMNYIFSLPLLAIFMLIYRIDVGWHLVWLPMIMATQLLLCTGISLITSTYNVFYRDLQQLINHILLLMFFAIPISYPLTAVPEKLRPIVTAFPLVWLIQSYQDIFFYNRSPDGLHLCGLALFALLLCWIGKRVFDRHKEVFAEYV
jgi:ABC-type polysaccharide/polyol phosphate export permease